MPKPKTSPRRPLRACKECAELRAANVAQAKTILLWMGKSDTYRDERDQARKDLAAAQQERDDSVSLRHSYEMVQKALDFERGVNKITTGALCIAEGERDAADKALAEYVRDWAHEQKWHAKVRESFLWLTDRPAMVCKPWWKRSFGDWLRARAGKGEGHVRRK